MIPLTALLVPRFTIFKELGLINTYVPLIAPAIMGTSPFYVLLFYWSFKRIPPELFEAAQARGPRPARDLVARGDAARPAGDRRGRGARASSSPGATSSTR